MKSAESVIQQYPAGHYILACSAGVDSMVMFNVFLRLKISFSVAHVNYHLRGTESDLDQQMLEQLCKKHNIIFHFKGIHLKEQLNTVGGNLQQEARNLRYRFFNSLLQKTPEAYIVTAHHEDDQVETFLIHLLRGSGLAGLAGMRTLRNRILRPFLKVKKSEIIACAIENAWDWREDESNKSEDYLRNKIRLSLLPFLLESNKNIHKDILFLQRICSETYLELEQQAVSLAGSWKKQNYIPVSDLNQDLSFVVEAFKALQIPPKFIPSIYRIASAENNKQIKLPEGTSEYTRLVKYKERIYLLGNRPIVSIKFEAEKVATLPDAFDKWTYYIDPSLLIAEPYLSLRKDIDSLIPIGMKKNKKVNPILKDAGIPLFQRSSWPVLFVENQIIGIPGICLSQKFAAPPQLDSYVKITFTPC